MLPLWPPWLLWAALLLAPAASSPPLLLALKELGARGQAGGVLGELRRLRNSRAVLRDLRTLYSVTDALDQAMRDAYEGDGLAAGADGNASQRPGNFHGVKSHSYFVGAISEAHPSFPPEAVQSIVASEWYHPGLAAKAVWCTQDCGLPLARRLDKSFAAIRQEVEDFWREPAALEELKGVGSHTTQFDRLIAGNGTWVDVRLWRGRAFHRRLCERHFRTVCGLVEASPEVWTNPWSHVLLSVLAGDSWVPFHQGHTNGQLTYHLPLRVPAAGGGAKAELALLERGGSLPEAKAERSGLLSHPEERVVSWTEGKTLVFDDSFGHAVRFRGGDASTDARVVLLMRAWHPELGPEEREAVRDFVRRGGEEQPEGYEMLPIGRSVFGL